MVSDRRKEQAAEQGANDVRQFWGEVDGERMSELGDSYLDALFMQSDGVYAGGQGLDAILQDLAGRSFGPNEVNSLLDAWRASADSAWSKSSEHAAQAEQVKVAEAGE